MDMTTENTPNLQPLFRGKKLLGVRTDITHAYDCNADDCVCDETRDYTFEFENGSFTVFGLDPEADISDNPEIFVGKTVTQIGYPLVDGAIYSDDLRINFGGEDGKFDGEYLILSNVEDDIEIEHEVEAVHHV